MLTPPFWCISVALCMSRVTCCIDTSENQSGHRRVLGSVEYFWRKASTNRQGTTLAHQRLELTPMPTLGSALKSPNRKISLLRSKAGSTSRRSWDSQSRWLNVGPRLECRSRARGDSLWLHPKN
jgi:hypothetical protein